MQTLKEFLTHNWFAKLFSLGLATLLWISVASEATSEVGMTVPVEYRNIPSQMEISGDAAKTVEVRLRGSANSIRDVTSQDVSVIIDLSSWSPGERLVQLTPQNVRSPFGIDVVRVAPSRLKLTLEHTITRQVPVEPKLEGRAAPGFEVQAATVDPQTVGIQGPESKLRDLQSVPTVPVHINGRTAGFTEQTEVDLPDASLRLESVAPVEVHVNITELHKGSH